MTFRKITSWYTLGTQQISMEGSKYQKLSSVNPVIVVETVAQGGHRSVGSRVKI